MRVAAGCGEFSSRCVVPELVWKFIRADLKTRKSEAHSRATAEMQNTINAPPVA